MFVQPRLPSLTQLAGWETAHRQPQRSRDVLWCILPVVCPVATHSRGHKLKMLLCKAGLLHFRCSLPPTQYVRSSVSKRAALQTLQASNLLRIMKSCFKGKEATAFMEKTWVCLTLYSLFRGDRMSPLGPSMRGIRQTRQIFAFFFFFFLDESQGCFSQDWVEFAGNNSSSVLAVFSFPSEEQ